MLDKEAKPSGGDIDKEARGTWELRFDFRLPAARFREHVKPFFRELMNAEHLQIAYLGAYITQPNLHMHIVAIGTGKMGKRITDIDRLKWERLWGEITGMKSNALHIGDIDRPKDAENYLIKNLSGDPDGEPFFYNRKLLQKSKLV